MIRKTLVSFIVLISTLLVMSPLAHASETTRPHANNDGTLTIVEHYPETAEAPVLPVAITQGDKKYILEKTSTAIDQNAERPSQHFVRTAFSQVPVEEIHNLRAHFPATHVIDEGHFQGHIGLDSGTPFSIEERYHAYRVQVDKTITIDNLPDNDVSRIPTTQSFEVVSETELNATQWKTLQLLDVSYTVVGTDHLGLPNNYQAQVTYRGLEGFHELAFYDVTAHYSGDITSSVEQMATTGIYTLVKPAEVVADPVVEPMEEEKETSFFPLIIAGTAAVVLLALPLIFFFFLKNACLARVAPERKHNNLREAKRGSEGMAEIICRRRLVLKNGMAEFHIPPTVNILDGELYHLTIKPRLSNKEGEVMLVWQGRTMAVLPLERHTDINFREILISSAETILNKTGVLD